jgi:hypothetical protein
MTSKIYVYCKTDSKKELDEFMKWCNQFTDPQIVIDSNLAIDKSCFRMPLKTDLWWSLRRDPSMKMINWNTKEEIN